MYDIILDSRIAILFLIGIAIFSGFVGLVYGGCFTKRWGGCIQLVYSSPQGPLRSVSESYAAGSIHIREKNYIKGLLLPEARSGTMPAIKNMLVREGINGSTFIAILCMEQEPRGVYIGFQNPVYLAGKPGQAFHVTILDPTMGREMEYQIRLTTEAVSVLA